MSAYIKIPRERVGVLIGSQGDAKRIIQDKGDVILQVDSEEGEVELTPKPDADPVNFWCSQNVVKAIGRGFSPQRAFRLFDEEDAMLELIDLRLLVGKSRLQLQRVRSRIIGKGGKIRALIEELTGAYLSVYGHTVGLIGDLEQVRIGKEAVMMIIKGCSHKTVLRFLHRKRSELKRRVSMLWEK